MLPNPKCNKIILQLNDMLESGNVNQIELRKIKKNLLDLRSTDPVNAHVVLGIISCLEHNIAEMRKNHELAIKFQNDSHTVGNYSVSLSKYGLYLESAKYSLIAFEKDKKDLQHFRYVRDQFFYSGQFSSCLIFLKKYKPLYINDPGEYQQITVNEQIIDLILRFLHTHNISEQDVINAISASLEITQKKSLLLVDPNISLMSFSDEEWLDISFVIRLRNDSSSVLEELDARFDSFNPIIKEFISIDFEIENGPVSKIITKIDENHFKESQFDESQFSDLDKNMISRISNALDLKK